VKVHSRVQSIQAQRVYEGRGEATVFDRNAEGWVDALKEKGGQRPLRQRTPLSDGLECERTGLNGEEELGWFQSSARWGSVRSWEVRLGRWSGPQRPRRLSESLCEKRGRAGCHSY
jgi:hypothetical protein